MFKRYLRLLNRIFTFNRSERSGMIILVIILLGVMVFPVIYEKLFPQKQDDLVALTRKLQHIIDSTAESEPTETKLPVTGIIHPFNPNTIARDSLLQYGLSEKLISEWIHYREKGGNFKVKQDILKLYGMDTLWYKYVYAYVLLPSVTDSSIIKYKKLPPKVIEFAPIEINTADTTLLMRLSGIGTKRANAIVKYRDRLGGFYNKFQLRDIRILPDSVLEVIWNRISLDPTLIKKININTYPLDLLMQHPYIGKKMGLIIDTRRQAEPIKDSTDLMNVPGMDVRRMRKLFPYLIF